MQKMYDDVFAEPTIVCERASELMCCAVCRLNTPSDSHSFSMKIDFSSSFFSPFLRLPFSTEKPGMIIHKSTHSKRRQRAKRRVLVQEKRKLAQTHETEPREKREREKLSILSQILFVILLFRMFYVLVDIFRFSVVSFHLPRNLYIDPKVFYYTTENQFSLQCVLV
jgi:hypothetical protein